MGGKGTQSGEDELGQIDGSEPAETDSVGWCDIFEAGQHTSESAHIADEHQDRGEAEAKRELRGRTKALEALQRASELFVGLSDSVYEDIQTYVTELPQWFHHSESIEIRIRVGTELFETDGFQRTADSLAAGTQTRTGTTVSMTVVCMNQQPGTEQRTWQATERQLVETLVSLITDEIDRWEMDSLKRVSDGVAALDGDLKYTYVNQQAVQILGRDSEELCGEFVWDVFPEAADTIAEDKIKTALETQSSTTFERYTFESVISAKTIMTPSSAG